MQRTKRRMALLFGLVSVLSLGAACSSDSKTTTTASSTAAASSSAAGCTVTGASVDYTKLSGSLNGSGASFPDVAYQKFVTDFKAKASGVAVTYTKSGSSAGKQDLQNGVVQFAGSDSTVKDEDKAKFKGEFLYFPTVAAPITVSYNLPGVDKLQLSGETVAGIFATSIKTWNDPKIVADNPGVTLPSTAITVVHRSDGSGTTSNFTKYLTKAGGAAWTLGSGDTVNWDASTQGGDKNSGVAAVVKGAFGAVGYVDLADAVNAGLKTAAIKNTAGKYVEPKLPATSSALAGAEVKADLTYDPLDAAGDETYAITAPTWILVYINQPDQVTADALKGWLNFILTDGQKAANAVGYAALPCELANKAVAQLEKIKVG